MNKLYLGDNLEILRKMDDGRVEFICFMMMKGEI